MRRLVAACLAVAMTLPAARAHAKSKGPHYDSDKPVPAGYHVEQRSNAVLAIVGGAVLLTGTALIVYGVREQNAERQREEDRRAADPNYTGSSDISSGYLSILNGVILAASGAPLLIVGLATKRTVLVPDTVTVTPVATQSFGGLSVVATF